MSGILNVIKQSFRYFLGFALIVSLIWSFFGYYSIIFAKTVKGSIENVARVTELQAIVGTRVLPEASQYSFSVSIRQPDGQLLTATTEDRQWAVAKSGLCVVAKFFPYPPWDLEKAGTYHGARLLGMFECNSQAAKENGISLNLTEDKGAAKAANSQ